MTLYDWVIENQEKILQMLKEFDPDDMGNVSKDDFCDTISGMQAPVKDEELKKVGRLYFILYAFIVPMGIF